MSDQFGPTADDEGKSSPPPPPAPPPAPPMSPIEAPLTLDTESDVTRSAGIGGRVVAGALGALLVVGGTVFAVTQLGSSGPSSAEDAVAELIDAAGNEDLLGLMAALDPGERDALRAPVEDMFGEFERLEVVDDSFELGGVEGIDFEFDDVTYRTEPVRDGLARVYLTGGTVTSSIDSDELPIGDFVEDTVERLGGETAGFQESDTADIFEDGGDEIFLVARDAGDGWRVSIAYTIAEAARIDAAQPLPTEVVEPIGAGSPEDAVRGLADAAVALDARGVIARLSPKEFAALQDYATLALGGTDSELAEADDTVDIEIEELDLRSETAGDRATVFVDGFAFSATFEGETVSVRYLDGCLDLEGDALDEFFLFLDDSGDSPFADGPLCGDDLQSLGDDGAGFGFGDAENPFADLEPVETPTIGITTHRVDGEWFVAPISTVLDSMVAGLQVIERSHLDAVVEIAESFFFGFGSSFEESFEETGESITGDYDDQLSDEFDDTLATDQRNFVALEELVSLYASDAESAECILRELFLLYDAILIELGASFAEGFDASVEAQDAFFAAASSCE